MNGRLKVNSALQVIGLDNVYAIGDCCNTSEEKMAAHAESHAICVATNIWRTLQGKNKLPYRQGKYQLERVGYRGSTQFLSNANCQTKRA